MGGTMTRKALLISCFLVSALLAVASLRSQAATTAAQADRPPELASADESFAKQNFRDAADGYREFLKGAHPGAHLFYARLHLMASELRQQHFDDALTVLADGAKSQAGTIWEPRTERALG